MPRTPMRPERRWVGRGALRVGDRSSAARAPSSDRGVGRRVRRLGRTSAHLRDPINPVILATTGRADERAGRGQLHCSPRLRTDTGTGDHAEREPASRIGLWHQQPDSPQGAGGARGSNSFETDR